MMKTAFAVALGAIVTIFSVYGVQFIVDRQSNFDLDIKGLFLGILYYFAMLIGVVASERYAFFSKNDVDRADFLKMFNWAYAFRALLVSPFIFASIVTSLGRDANVLMSVVFAFQNGFFWETIFRNQPKSHASTTTSTK